MPAKPADEDSNMDSEDSDSDEDSDDEEAGGSGAPVLQAIFCYIPDMIHLTFILLSFDLIYVHIHVSCSHVQLRKVAHEGCVNRIRAMTQNPHICASWADTGHVQVRLYILISWMSSSSVTIYINMYIF